MSLPKNITSVVIDDEPLARKGVEILISESENITHLGSFENALRSIDFLKNNQVDLLFLDIEMPGLNGLEFLRTLKPTNFVVLTTAYPQYALEAFELSVVDYLLKPIRLERFTTAINKVHDLIELHSHEKSEITEHLEDHFYIKSDRKFVKLFYEEISYIKGLKDYVVIYTNKGAKYMTAMNVKTIHGQLPPKQFARVSKSYVINVSHMVSLDVDLIYLNNDIEIPLGNSYKQKFLHSHVNSKLFQR